MQRIIKFTAGGSSATYGNFAPGDLLRCPEAAAKHFVEEACCAKWADQAHKADPAADFQDTQPAAAPAEAPAAAAPEASKPARKRTR